MNFKKFKIVLLIFLIIFVSLPIYGEDEGENDNSGEETQVVDLISKQKYTDIDAQYKPTADQNAFIWYLQYAKSSEVVEFLKKVFDVEIENGEIIFVESKQDNAIIVRVKSPDNVKLHHECIDVLKQLDIRTGQVLIDVLIAQIKVKNDNSRGFEWQYQATRGLNQDDLNTNVAIDHDTIFNEALRNKNNGFKYLISKTDRLKAFISNLANDDRLKVISSPHIIATANREAIFKIQQVVPIIKSREVLDGGSVQTETEDFEAGIVLRVTPRIGQGDNIILQITQNIDEVEYDPIEKQAEKTLREISTRLSLDNHQTIALGGFMKNSKRVYNEKIPFLSSIPLVGKLFNKKVTTNEKTELIVFITPRIISTFLDSNNARDILVNNVKSKKILKKELKKISGNDFSFHKNQKIFINSGASDWYYYTNMKSLTPLIENSARIISIHKIIPKHRRKRCRKGRAPLGYGPIVGIYDIYNTKLNKSNNYLFIKQFNVKNPDNYKDMDLKVASDNAAMIYINGILVDRDPMINTLSGHDMKKWNREVKVSSKLLRKGKNLVVGILKNDKRSVETFFDLKLIGNMKIHKKDKKISKNNKKSFFYKR